MKSKAPPILRWFFTGAFLGLLTLVALTGLRDRRFTRPPIEVFPDMDRQAKFKSQAPTDKFVDGRSSRLPVPGTVPVEAPVASEYFMTGRMGNRWGDGIPLEVNPQLLARGKERFTITCKSCHGNTGAGNGIAKSMGLVTVATMLDDRIRQMPDGEIFHTLTNGKNTMASLPHITPEDRWAIIAYIRALQLRAGVDAQSVPEHLRRNLPALPATPTEKAP